MIGFIDLLIVMAVVLFSLNAVKKGKDQAKARSTHTVPNQPRGEYTKPAKTGGDIYHKAQNAAQHAASEWRKNLYEADRDSHYDRGSLDDCDSDGPSSAGITFRNLPAGTDDLSYLVRWNENRERMLEKSLESRE